MSIIQKLVAAVAAVFAVCSYAREITSMKIVQGSGSTKALVSLTAGEAGDGHVLYVAYGAKNCGDTLYAWANEGGVTPCLKVADDATSVSVELSGDAAKAAYHKAFLVKKLETPAFLEQSNNGRLLECIRSDNGLAWFVTDYFCSGNEAISITVGNAANRDVRMFGARSSDTNSCFEVYNSYGTSWSYVYPSPQDDVPYAYAERGWPNVTFAPVAEKTELTLDAKNKCFKMRLQAGNTLKVNIDKKLMMDETKMSDYPLCIFASSDSVDGEKIYRGGSLAGALLYGFSVMTNDVAYARYYIPASFNSSACIWDAVENKIVNSSKADTYQRSKFLVKNSDNVEYSSVDFHAVVPGELQAKYETVVSACNADRQIKEVSVERRSVTVSLTPGFSGGKDILYIAWGDFDKGDTLAAWGDNVYCAGEVADDATSVSVALPRGIYPNHFRAFLLKRSDIDCDAFVEYIISNGSSEFETDYCAIRGDRISIKLALGSTDGNQRIFGAWDSKSTSTAIEIYTGSYTSGALNYGALANVGGTAQWPSQSFDYGVDEQILTYDSGSRDLTLVAKSQTTTKNMKNSSTGEDSSLERSSEPLAIFNSSRSYYDGHRVKSGAKFYWMEITNSSGVLERSYFPAKKGNEYGIWDAVQNRFIAPRKAESFSAQSALLAFSSLPMDKQSKYLTVVDSATAYRKEAGLRITIR